MTACSHTPSRLTLIAETDHRCDGCRMPCATPAPSLHRFIDPSTQKAHDKEAGVNV